MNTSPFLRALLAHLPDGELHGDEATFDVLPNGRMIVRRDDDGAVFGLESDFACRYMSDDVLTIFRDGEEVVSMRPVAEASLA